MKSACDLDIISEMEENPWLKYENDLKDCDWIDYYGVLEMHDHYWGKNSKKENPKDNLEHKNYEDLEI